MGSHVASARPIRIASNSPLVVSGALVIWIPPATTGIYLLRKCFAISAARFRTSTVTVIATKSGAQSKSTGSIFSLMMVTVWQDGVRLRIVSKASDGDILDFNPVSIGRRVIRGWINSIFIESLRITD